MATNAKAAKPKAQKNTLPPPDMMVDLASRFVLNAPAEELKSFERMLFLIEQAHWFYEDNVREQTEGLKSLSLKEFSEQMFQSVPQFKKYKKHIEDIYANFNSYKHTVPVHGGILLNPQCTKCVLVQGWGKSATFTFPKGKVNKDEASAPCAVREVFEETGFDISSRLREENRIEKSRGLQTNSLYVIPDVPESTAFECQTEKEIRQIIWYPISELPAQGDKGTDGKKFWMISPFLPALKKWIKQNKGNTPNYHEAMAADKAFRKDNNQTPKPWMGAAAWLGFKFKSKPILAHLPARPVKSNG